MTVIYCEELERRNALACFQARRLEEARLVNRLAKCDLARKIDRTRAYVSKWESGDKIPTLQDLDKIAEVTSLPRKFFLKPQLDCHSSPVFFRSMASITKAMRDRSAVRLRWAQEISVSLQQWVDLPALNIPQFEIMDHHRVCSQDIENIAYECRKLWKLGDGPISDILLTIENSGIIVIKDNVETAKMDGLSSWCEFDNRPYMLIAREKGTCVRSRMDAAHELGHLVLHRNIEPEILCDKYNFKEIERQAFEFASALLMPSESFVSEVHSLSLEAFSALKNRWKVSISAMMMRCQKLNVANEDHIRQLWRHYSFRGWHRGEPLDNELLSEEPRLLSRSIKLLVESGAQTKENLLDILSLNAHDVEMLCGLPDGYMTSEDADVVGINESFRSSASHEADVRSRPSGKVLPFKRIAAGAREKERNSG